MTPHSQYFPETNRSDTTSQPFKLIPGTSLFPYIATSANHWIALVRCNPFVCHLSILDVALNCLLEIPKSVKEGVHHWDENGLADHDEEPLDIQAIHYAEVEFVTAWLEEFELKN